MKFKQVTWDTYESKWCIHDSTEVCYKAECHESTGVKCCLACKRCNAWRSCLKRAGQGGEMKNYKVFMTDGTATIIKADGTVVIDNLYHTISFFNKGNCVAWFNTNNIAGYIEETTPTRKK